MNLLDMWQKTLETVALVCAPFLVAAIVVGVATSLLQAATQLQENAISFVPKIAVVGLIFALMGHWLLGELVGFADHSMDMLVRIAAEAGK